MRAAEHYRVIAFDRPGFGYSERPRSTIWTPQAQARLLRHALQELGVDSAIVLGHSWGTLVALSMALDAPDFVRGLVLLSGYYYPSLRADVPLLSAPAIPVIGDLMRYTVSPLAGRMLWRPFAKRPSRRWRSIRASANSTGLDALRPGQLRASAAETAHDGAVRDGAVQALSGIEGAGRHHLRHQDKIADFSHNSERLTSGSGQRAAAAAGRRAHDALCASGQGDRGDRCDRGAGRGAGALRDPQAEALARASESGVRCRPGENAAWPYGEAASIPRMTMWVPASAGTTGANR
jgi:pimeloyl-ACP methyl ester carboxylesterase